MSGTFDRFFRSSDAARDKYLSRLFGIFSEEVVRIWCACSQAEYEDLGRPSLHAEGESRGHQIDFTFRRRGTQDIYVVEMKCELEYERYRYLVLQHANQLKHHSKPDKPAFVKFLEIARNPSALAVRLQDTPIAVSGAILIWGSITEQGRDDVMRTYGFSDVRSVEAMTNDLQEWKPESWTLFVNRYRAWNRELFDFLAGDSAYQARST